MIDISLNQTAHHYCNGWSRRDFLRVGALAPLGLSLGGLLSMEKMAAAARPAGRAPSRSCWFFSVAASRTTIRST